MQYLLIAFLCLISVVHPVHAASTDTAAAESDYRFQFDRYRDAHRLYQVAKANFQQANTLKSEQDALVAAKSAAALRNEVLRTYTHWLRLQLLDQTAHYQTAEKQSTALLALENWYTDHTARVQAAGTLQSYEQANQLYIDHQAEQERLFLQGQIHLKLGQLLGFQTNTKNYYDQLNPTLVSLTSIPEVEQGMTKISQLGTTYNAKVSTIQTFSNSLEANSFRLDRLYSDSSEHIETLRNLQLQMLDLIIELDNRYVHKSL